MTTRQSQDRRTSPHDTRNARNRIDIHNDAVVDILSAGHSHDHPTRHPGQRPHTRICHPPPPNRPPHPHPPHPPPTPLDLPPTTVDDAELLLSELLTNAVRHGTGPTITVLASYDHGTLHCQVHNDTPHPPPEPPNSAAPPDHVGPHLGPPSPLPPRQPADPLAETGRGLHLVHTLATHWGSYHDPHTQHVTWFRLDATGQPPGTPTTAETDPTLLRRVLAALRTL